METDDNKKNSSEPAESSEVNLPGVQDALKAEWTNMIAKQPESRDDGGSTTSSPLEILQNSQSNEAANNSLNASPVISPDGNALKSGPGWKCQIKDLYASTASSCSCCTSWEDKKPFREREDKTAKKNSERMEFAIVRKQTPHGGHGVWKTSSIEVNSPIIRKWLVDVFSDYPAVSTHSVVMSFQPPFMPFIHRWDKLRQGIEQEKADDTKKHMRLLEELLLPEIEESLSLVRHIKNTGYVSYQDLELAFTPGEIIIRDIGGIRTAGLLRNTRSDEDGDFELSVQVVDWNGEHFGVGDTVWWMSSFGGSLKLTSLTHSPLRAYTNKEAIRQQLVAQGRKFEAFRGQHHRFYSGRAWCKPDDLHRFFYGPSQISKPIHERVIVDAEAYYTLQDDCIPPLSPLTSLDHLLNVDKEEGNQRTNENGEILSDNHCMIAVSKVKGFLTQSKEWCEVEVSCLTDIIWNGDAFTNLVLGGGEKRILLGVLSPCRDEVEFDDFIPGKGRGVVILLCGPPGVGKTLTAESVAEQLKRPLYKLEAGDIGSSASTVENALKNTLRRCTRWNAVLLIDEADVFLETRSKNDLQRNELVSIFLRLLEYYQGVMILTTNRTFAIDPAFESRIDITLQYPDLTLENRMKIWRNFLGTMKQKTAMINDEAVETLARYPLNGRQIKSALKTALIMSTSEKKQLTVEDLIIVLDLRQKSGNLLSNTSAGR